MRLLGLFSHEYFHAWNVKRLRVRRVRGFDYQRENTTELLWFFEGFTSYYDDLMLLRAASSTHHCAYLKLLAATVNGVLAAPGAVHPVTGRGQLRGLTEVLPPRREQPQRHGQLLRQGRAGGLCLDLALREQGRDPMADAPALGRDERWPGQ